MKTKEELATEYATKDCQRWIADKMVSISPVLDPDEFDAYLAGFLACRAMAIDCIKYSRYSIVLKDDGITRGYISACSDIENRVNSIGESGDEK